MVVTYIGFCSEIQAAEWKKRNRGTSMIGPILVLPTTNAAGVGGYNFFSGQTTYMLPVGHLPAGLYYIKLADERGRPYRVEPWVKG